MQIHELNTGTATDADYIPIDNGTDTRKIPFISTVNGLVHAISDAVAASLTSLSEYVGTGLTGTVSGAIAGLQTQLDTFWERLRETMGITTMLQSRMTYAENDISNRLLVWTGQLTASVSCPAGETTAVFSAYDVSDYLPDGATLKAATVGWTTGNLIPVNTQVIGGKLYVYLYNYKSAAVTVSNVAVQLFYTV